MIFQVTEDHIKLLKRMYVSWDDCEFGAPCIDPKRPYGNSDVEGDIKEITGIARGFRQIHFQMKIVLQILLRNTSIELGLYDLETWKKYNDDYKLR